MQRFRGDFKDMMKTIVQRTLRKLSMKTFQERSPLMFSERFCASRDGCIDNETTEATIVGCAGVWLPGALAGDSDRGERCLALVPVHCYTTPAVHSGQCPPLSPCV